MELYLIRHGETDYNVSRRYQGMWGESRLTENGKRQAAAGRTLISSIPFDRIYSSAALRTRETCAILFPEKHDIVFEDDIREVDVGWLTHLYSKEARAKYVEEFKVADAEHSFKMFDGESPQETLARAKKVIDRTVKNGGERVAIVSHGAFIRYMLAYLFGMDASSIANCDNCGVTLVTIRENGKATLKFYNRVADSMLTASDAF